jgi:hypothetical protein
MAAVLAAGVHCASDMPRATAMIASPRTMSVKSP